MPTMKKEKFKTVDEVIATYLPKRKSNQEKDFSNPGRDIAKEILIDFRKNLKMKYTK